MVGFANNLPINMLERRGIKDIIAIRVGSKFPIKDEKKLLSRKDLNIIFIEPNHELPSILAFDNQTCSYLMNLGYYDAIKRLDRLDGENYYFNPFDEQKCFDAFVNIEQENINKIYKLLKLKNVENSKKVFLEIIMPMVLKKIDKDNLSTYRSAMVAILEHAADVLEINKFNIYSLEECVLELREKTKSFSSKNKISKASKVILEIVKSLNI